MEADIETVRGQAPYLLGRSVIADADDWHLSRLNHLDYRSHSSSIPCTHSVYLVHYYQRFLQIFSDV